VPPTAALRSFAEAVQRCRALRQAVVFGEPDSGGLGASIREISLQTVVARFRM
jgi:hypothetical protein